jgi:Family of unknown function (DUF6152)
MPASNPLSWEEGMSKLSVLFVFAFTLIGSTVPASAHHGTAGYDMEKVVTVKGTVASFDWSNPHCVVFISSKNEKGESEDWTIELAAPGIMARFGWSKNSLKPGDDVVAETHPAKTGAPSGLSGAAAVLLKFVVNGQSLPSL